MQLAYDLGQARLRNEKLKVKRLPPKAAEGYPIPLGGERLNLCVNEFLAGFL